MLRVIDFRLFVCLVALLLSAGRAYANEPLLLEDVRQIIAQAATEAARSNPRSVIAVVDREGFVLGVWDVSGGPQPPSQEIISAAISRAGTAAFLSSNQNAFTSRTAGYIIQQHFPPG